MATTPAEVDANNLMFRLAHLARRWRQVLDLKIQTAGLTDATWRPLLHLHLLGDGTRQKDLAASVGIEGPSLVRLLDSLVSKGMMERSECPTDRRAKLLSLTPSGKGAVTQIHLTVRNLERELLSPFEQGEMSVMAELVQRLEASVHEVRRREMR